MDRRIFGVVTMVVVAFGCEAIPRDAQPPATAVVAAVLEEAQPAQHLDPEPLPAPATPQPVLGLKKPSRPRRKVPVVIHDHPQNCDEIQCLLDPTGRPCCDRFPPRRPPPAPVVVSDRLDRQDIIAGIAPIKGPVQACPRAGFTGTVKVRLSIGKSGRISELKLEGGPPPSELSACMIREIGRARFRVTAGGPIKVIFPFNFS